MTASDLRYRLWLNLEHARQHAEAVAAVKQAEAKDRAQEESKR
jgi:hypothetical protein